MVGDLDPLKGGAQSNVRYVSVEGVGEQAVAVFETKDAQRGILDDAAMLVVQRGHAVVNDSSLGAAKRTGLLEHNN